MEGYAKNEQVRDVVGYEGLYGVSNKGNVYSLRSGCLIEGQKGAYVTLSKVRVRVGVLATWLLWLG